MTILETVLVFVCIPLAVIGLIFGLVYGGAAARSKRYRPGRPFTTTPVWFLADPQPGAKSAPVAAAHPELVGPDGAPVSHGEVGGASDNW